MSGLFALPQKYRHCLLTDYLYCLYFIHRAELHRRLEQASMNTAEVFAESLKVGSLIEVGGKAHRINTVRDYPNFGGLCYGYTARIANCDTGLSITLVDGQMVREVAA